MGVRPCYVFSDGSYATPVYTVALKKPLTQQQVQGTIDASGLSGLTYTDKGLLAYYVGNPEDTNAMEAFENGIEKAKVALGANGGTYQEKVQRLWVYGGGSDATHPYEAIRGEFPSPSANHATAIPRLLAERQTGRPVITSAQAARIGAVVGLREFRRPPSVGQVKGPAASKTVSPRASTDALVKVVTGGIGCKAQFAIDGSKMS
jgi:hypothetical protein